MNANIIKATFQLPQVYQILTIFFMPLGFFCSQICFFLVNQAFDFEPTWCRLFLKRVMRTKFNIYFSLITHRNLTKMAIN